MNMIIRLGKFQENRDSYINVPEKEQFLLLHIIWGNDENIQRILKNLFKGRTFYNFPEYKLIFIVIYKNE